MPARAARTARKIDPRRITGPVVYLLHFRTPYQHARHYVGWSASLAARLAHHENGTGARLMAAVANAGIGYDVARVWEGATRTFERRIHNGRRTRHLCPICSGEKALDRAVFSPQS